RRVDFAGRMQRIVGVALASTAGVYACSVPFAEERVDSKIGNDAEATATDATRVDAVEAFGDTSIPDTDVSADESSDASDAGICCPPDKTPSCCMAYGGARKSWGCSAACDGMPVPSDPGWRLENDTAGCPVWTHPYDSMSKGGTMNPQTRYC